MSGRERGPLSQGDLGLDFMAHAAAVSQIGGGLDIDKLVAAWWSRLDKQEITKLDVAFGLEY